MELFTTTTVAQAADLEPGQISAGMTKFTLSEDALKSLALVLWLETADGVNVQVSLRGRGIVSDVTHRTTLGRALVAARKVVEVELAS